MAETVWRGRGYPEMTMPDGTVMAATSRECWQPGVNKFKAVDGKLVEIFGYFDNLDYFASIGWLDDPAALALVDGTHAQPTPSERAPRTSPISRFPDVGDLTDAVVAGRAFGDAFNRRDADTMVALCADDVIGFSPSFTFLHPRGLCFQGEWSDRPGPCREGHVGYVRYLAAAAHLPESRKTFRDEALSADGTVYMVESTWRGLGYPEMTLPNGAVMPATDRECWQPGVNKLKFRDGKIVEIFGYTDNLDYFASIGWLGEPAAVEWLAGRHAQPL
jgi:hypothetical protein